MVLSKHAQFVLEDLQTGNTHSSWDWPADLRFAKHFSYSDAVEVLEKMMQSDAPLACLCASHDIVVKPIKKKRLAAVRELVRHGYVDVYWETSGEGGATLYGVNRFRCYLLRKEYETESSPPRRRKHSES